MVTENERWLLSFYRASEISGALFFGRLARSMKPGQIQHDMTKHFADESMHSWYWTQCLSDLGTTPIKLRESYQDQYLEATGLPVNVMEVLAITQVFEQRVISQYSVHASLPNLDPHIHSTLKQIMEDEKWHIKWIKEALTQMQTKYGETLVESTLQKYRQADREVYKQTLAEHEFRLQEILTPPQLI